jgi:hypothetical protein
MAGSREPQPRKTTLKNSRLAKDLLTYSSEMHGASRVFSESKSLKPPDRLPSTPQPAGHSSHNNKLHHSLPRHGREHDIRNGHMSGPEREWRTQNCRRSTSASAQFISLRPMENESN